ncbi:hypothetical protein O1611_g607 [Lasiodiplodia mahajangana]|uniref:Uncharacterized protein n=1 Tax=Lasiodiplodia mahajangana TaxID=1108764 RepID=A0ACC2JZX9_9PEZI|nr:hypothetical protein O1611_g607 [Lasiodiplodia mahajangana]
MIGYAQSGRGGVGIGAIISHWSLIPLRQLFPDPGSTAPGHEAKVDIIAIHGLNPRSKSDADHAWDTWRTPAGPSGRLWLRDDLPQYVPESRIFLYEYNATAVYGKDRDTFIGKANELLEAIRVERDGVESRPIIFLCHSMGGLLVKQALINAHSNPKHTPTKRATSGLAFFATPHNGGDWKLVSLGRLAAKVATSAGFQKGDDVLETLKKGSIFSEIMQEQFRHQLLEYDIISFWGGLDNIVPIDSARIGMPGDRENVVKLNADHSTLCKFGSGQTDQDNLKLVRYNIKDIYTNALKKTPGQPPVDAYLSTNEARPYADELASKRPCHYIPLPKNTQFTGRDNILDKLRRKLFIEQECRTLAIVGLGGIGKTQLVLQLAYWVKETQHEYSVFWVPALSQGSFEQAYAEIAKRAGIQINLEDSDPTDSVRQYLESERAGKWLLIVDNADDKDLVFGQDGNRNGLHRFLPANDQGLILYTTRSRQVAVWAAKNEVLDLGQLDPNEATILFQKAIIQQSIRADTEQVAKLLQELGYIPLAITHAVAYLNETQLPITKYLGLLRGAEEDKMKIMTGEFYDHGRYPDSQNAIANTWIVSFEKIAKSNPFAAQLLSFVSCIEPKAIPQSLLSGTDKPKSDIEHAIGTLCGYSFLVRRGESDMFDMHALVHAATRIWINERGRPRETITNALHQLEAVFPWCDESERDLWREYLPHALRALENSNGYDMQKRYELLHLVGRCLYADRRFKEALLALEEARPGFPSVLGNNYTESDQLSPRIKAMQLFKRMARIPGKTMIRRESNTHLHFENILAAAYLDNRQIGKATPMLERIVDIQQRTLAEEDEDRLTAEHRLGCAYLESSNLQVSKAIAIFEKVVAIRQRTVAEEDGNRLAAEYGLACAYLQGNDLQVRKAIALLEHIVDVRKGI